MKRARRIVSTLIAAGAVLRLGSAMAADLPPIKARPFVPTVYHWTGFYGGANAGAAFGRSDTASTAAVLPGISYFPPTDIPALQSAGAQSLKSWTFTGGLTAGYNWQLANVVVGLEADFSYFGAKGTKTGTAGFPGYYPYAATITSSAASDWLMTFRPRVGVLVTPALLLYGTAGLAVADLRARFNYTDNFAGGGAESAAISTTRVGWSAGAGAEYALINGWSIKAEYLYVDLGRASTISTNLVSPQYGPLPGNFFTQSASLHANIARVGFNYHWGDQVIARY